MNIGQASERSGISPKMIRYYEQIGLLDTAKRSNSGYRIYSNQDIKNLCFLRQARDLGFSSKQMKELLNLWTNTDRKSAAVQKLTLTDIHTLNRKIAQLQDMVSLLQISADHCSGNENAECAILEDLEQGE